MSSKTIGVAVITYRDKRHLSKCLPLLVTSPLNPRVLVVNSSSNDGTIEEAATLGAETLVVPRNEFNHGSTRELARKHLNTDIVVMMTPDAYPVDETMLEKLVAPLLKGISSISYARQLPRDGADIFEAFPRLFNYPPESNIRGIEDAGKYGVYTFFCSNSCAAYVNSALDEIDGFKSTMTNEDYFAVASLLKSGHKISYVAEAAVKHSHSYTLWQELKRYFDTGYVRAENPWVQNLVGHAENRGKEFFKELLKQLAKNRPLLIPYAFVNTFVKLLGFRIGYHSVNAPLWLKRILSSQDFYWISRDFIEHSKKKL